MKEPHGQRSYYPRHQPGGIGPARHGTRKNPAYRSGSSLHGAPNGRAELDEHVQSVESAEIDVDLQMGSRSKADVLQEIRDKVSVWPGTNVSLGQPISHRIDHMLSGTLANIALKIFGDDLRTLRLLGRQVQTAISGVPGVVDLSMEQQTDIPTLNFRPDPLRVARYSLPKR